MKSWVALLLMLCCAQARAATYALQRATQPVSQDGDWNTSVSTHGLRNAAGTTINPATSETQVAISTTLAELNAKVSTTTSSNAVFVQLSSGTNRAYVTSDGKLLVETGGTEVGSFYAADPGPQSAATADIDNPMLMFVNLSTNTKQFRLISHIVGTEVVNVQTTFRMFLNPVITSSGTAISATKIYQTGVASAQTQVFKTPTISSSGSSIESIPQGQNTPASIVQDNESVAIDPGNVLLFTARPNSNNRTVWISVRWVEK